MAASDRTFQHTATPKPLPESDTPGAQGGDKLDQCRSSLRSPAWQLPCVLKRAHRNPDCMDEKFRLLANDCDVNLDRPE